jgi:hypothetical protein
MALSQKPGNGVAVASVAYPRVNGMYSVEKRGCASSPFRVVSRHETGEEQPRPFRVEPLRWRHCTLARMPVHRREMLRVVHMAIWAYDSIYGSRTQPYDGGRKVQLKWLYGRCAGKSKTRRANGAQQDGNDERMRPSVRALGNITLVTWAKI